MENLTVVYLELIAAKARQLAIEHKQHKLWEGDLSKGISELREIINKADDSAKIDQNY